MLEMNISIILIIIIIIIISIVICYGMMKFVDDKLSSVIVNVPQPDYQLPPIYLAIDKDSNIKRIKLNDVITTSETNIPDEDIYTTSPDFNDSLLNYENFEQSPKVHTDNTDNTNNVDKNNDINNENINTDLDSYITENSTNSSDTYDNIEDFGNLKVHHDSYDNERQALISGQIGKKNKIINNDNKFDTQQDPNFNTLNNIPLLVSPDIVSPNMKFGPSYPYYTNRAKLVDKKNSPLVELQEIYLNKINKATIKEKNKRKKESLSENFISSANLPNKQNSKQNVLANDGVESSYYPYDGYNSHVDLKKDSYANVSSIGKSFLTPYISFPVPS